MSGKQDEGDIAFRSKGRFIVHEYKNTQTWSYSKLLDYLQQAKEEAGHFAARRFIDPSKVHYAVVLKVHQKGWSEGAVLLPMSEYLRLIGESDDV